MNIKAGLSVDIGNSETRVALMTGGKTYFYKLSNKFAELRAGYQINDKYMNGKSYVLQVNKTYYANGQLVDREFKGVELRPSSLQSKTDQLVTELTFNLIFYKALLILSKVYSVPISNMKVTFNISTLLPPLDQEVNSDKLKEKLKSITQIDAYLPVRLQSNIEVENVEVLPEGVTAFFGALFTDGVTEEDVSYIDDIVIVNDGKGLEEVEENKTFNTGYVLILDIGAGTTDVSLILDMELVEASKDTFNRGGNTVQSIITNELKKKYGFSPTDLSRVISEAVLEEGVDTYNVEDIVTYAKSVYSKMMISDLRQYLERLTIPMQSIKGLLVVGGGALPSVRDGVVVSPSMAEVLMGYLKELAPRIRLVDTKDKNLRDLNILGLSYIHKYL